MTKDTEQMTVGSDEGEGLRDTLIQGLFVAPKERWVATKAYRHTYDDLLRVVEQIGFEPSEEVWREVWGVWQFGLGCKAPSWATCHRWRERRRLRCYDGTKPTGKRMDATSHRPVPDSVIDAIVSDPDLPRGWYASHVARGGWYPGVLSGAELKGEARNWGAWYHEMRSRVESVAYKHDVVVRYVQPTGARVWHFAPSQ